MQLSAPYFSSAHDTLKGLCAPMRRAPASSLHGHAGGDCTNDVQGQPPGAGPVPHGSAPHSARRRSKAKEPRPSGARAPQGHARRRHTGHGLKKPACPTCGPSRHACDAEANRPRPITSRQGLKKPRLYRSARHSPLPACLEEPTPRTAPTAGLPRSGRAGTQRAIPGAACSAARAGGPDLTTLRQCCRPKPD